MVDPFCRKGRVKTRRLSKNVIYPLYTYNSPLNVCDHCNQGEIHGCHMYDRVSSLPEALAMFALELISTNISNTPRRPVFLQSRCVVSLYMNAI